MYAVILAGGGGTRLWPLSRAARPKPFLPLLGPLSLLQATVARLSPLIESRDVYVVTDRRYAGLVREQLPEMPPDNVLVEPFGRNTAAAVALAALAIDRPPDDVMAVLPADHRITDDAGFRAALETGARSAIAEARLVTLGIRPTGPETGYGYIVEATDDRSTDAGSRETAGPASDHPAGPTPGSQMRSVERFVEKPSREAAKGLLDGGRAHWNAGIFVWTRGRLLECLDRYVPAVVGPIRDALMSAHDLAESYGALPATSIDYALLEPASGDGIVGVVPVDVGWSDVGSWAAVLDALSRPEDGDGDATSRAAVVARGASMDVDSDDVLVQSAGGRLVVTIGLRGTIVVDTPDVVLVCARDHAQDVKRVVDRLAAAKEMDRL